MLTYGDASYSYSLNGSLTYKIVGTDTTWYNYDLLGNLISVTLPDGTLIEYIIDGQNRRVGKKVDGVFQKGWLYQDQLNPVVELDENGDPALGFVYGTKGHVPDFMVTPDSSYRFITDHLGSVRLVVNAETGIVRQRLEYDEFGNVILDTNPGFQPFGYAGGLYDAQTGLVRFGARDYDAETGRWTAKDPIRFAGGFSNFYEYCSNNPVCLIDLWGLQEIVIYSKSGSGSIGKPVSGTSSGSWGHAWIEFISPTGESYGVGFYPSSKLTGREFLNDVAARTEYDAKFTFSVTEETYNNVVESVNTFMKNGPDWSLNNNCVDFVVKALDEAGIEHPSFNTLGISDPKKLVNWLKKLNKENSACN